MGAAIDKGDEIQRASGPENRVSVGFEADDEIGESGVGLRGELQKEPAGDWSSGRHFEQFGDGGMRLI